jgi:RNA polymerase sigma-70 factor (ECF subfamily)
MKPRWTGSFLLSMTNCIVWPIAIWRANGAKILCRRRRWFTKVDWKNRVHFFAISAGMMRRILVEFARSRKAVKRGGDVCKVELDEAAAIAPLPDEDLIRLDEALNALAAVDPRQAKVVELRFFGGLTEEETAEALQVSSDTVLRDWKRAKLRLWREMTHDRGNKS